MTRSTARAGSWPVPVAVVLSTVAAAVALLAGCASGQGTVVAPAGSSVVPGASQAADRPDTSTVATRPPGGLPASLRIPSIDATSTLVPLGQNADGTVQVPPVTTPMQAGWYAGGAAPGEPGPAVLLGHVDGDRQMGIFYRLHELVPGATVRITRADGSVLTFTVTKVDKVPKSSFPTQAVYGATPDPELRLLTCGGSFNPAAHSYVDNVIVYAKLTT
jgi:hypothetical protein